MSTRATTSEGVLTDSASRPTGHSGDRLQDETQPSRRRDEAENPLDTLEEYTPVRPSHTRRRRTLRDILKVIFYSSTSCATFASPIYPSSVVNLLKGLMKFESIKHLLAQLTTNKSQIKMKMTIVAKVIKESY